MLKEMGYFGLQCNCLSFISGDKKVSVAQRFVSVNEPLICRKSDCIILYVITGHSLWGLLPYSITAATGPGVFFNCRMLADNSSG